LLNNIGRGWLPLKRSSAVLFGILLVLIIDNTPGDILSAGYDFAMPGKHAAATVLFTQAMVTLQAQCVSGSGEGCSCVDTKNNATADCAERIVSEFGHLRECDPTTSNRIRVAETPECHDNQRKGPLPL
jgi:hypothetical protein